MTMQIAIIILGIHSIISSCNPGKDSANVVAQVTNPIETSATTDMKMRISIGTSAFNATIYDTPTGNAFKERLPLTISMSDLNANEKYFDLPHSLPTNASNPGTIQIGDLMLYGSNTLVLFYKTFSTSYNYTRLAWIDNPSGLAAALGSGNITVKFQASE
jgi:hypothetical protein